MIRTVYFYRETFTDDTDEIITLCKACANKKIAQGDNLEQIDKAASFDSCGECEAENTPDWYNPRPQFISGTLN